MDFYIDTREPQEIFDFAKAYKPKSVKLDSADFTMKVPSDDESSPIGIERKRVNDFIGSMKRKRGEKTSRLDKQIRKMSHDYNIRILMIVGSFEQLDSILKRRGHSLNPKAIYSKMASICCRNNFHIFMAENDLGAVEAAYKFCRMVDEGQYDLPKIKIKTPRNLLREIPGVTKTSTKGLRREFGSFRELACASCNQLQRVKGIGPKRAQQIYDYFDHAL